MYDKQHVVFEQYTDLEKNIEALSHIKADCMFNLDVGRCTSYMCTVCKKYQMLEGCIDQLSVCDQLIVDHESTNIFNSRKYEYYSYLTYKKRRLRNKIIVIVITIIAGILLWVLLLSM